MQMAVWQVRALRDRTTVALIILQGHDGAVATLLLCPGAIPTSKVVEVVVERVSG